MKRRSAFTFVELVIGLTITAIVLAALATVTYAVSVNWKAAESIETNYLAGAQVQARLAQWFRRAATLGATRTGSLSGTGSAAAAFFWKGDSTDASNPTGDGTIQFNEIALIEHDRTSGELRLYTVADWATWSVVSQTAANALAGSAYIGNALNVSDFKQACGSYQTLVRHVDGLVIKSYTTSNTPMLEYLMKLQRPDGTAGTYYGTISLRAAISPSN